MGTSLPGKSSLRYSPPCHSIFSDPSSPCSAFLFSCRRKNAAVLSCLQQESSKDSELLKRRVVLLTSIGVIPFLSPPADALDGLPYGWNRRGRTKGRPSNEKKTELTPEEIIESITNGNQENIKKSDPENLPPPQTPSLPLAPSLPSPPPLPLPLPEPSTPSLSLAPSESLPLPLPPSPSSSSSPSSSPIIPVLNSFGVLASGVLASLYASTLKEKATSDATAESMSIKLKEKEATIDVLEKKLESKIVHEKEVREKELAKANEVQQTLSERLNIANGTITDLGKTVQKEKRSVEELSKQVENLEINLNRAGDEKREMQEQLQNKLDSVAALEHKISLLCSEIRDKEHTVQSLSSKIAKKEHEFDQLYSTHKQFHDQKNDLNSEIGELKKNLLESERELERKNLSLTETNAELTSLLVERNESSQRYDATVKEFELYKSSIENKAISDSDSLKETEKRLHLVEDQLKVALEEANKDKFFITDLTREKDNLEELLDIQLKNVNRLEQELNITQETLQSSRNEVSYLSNQLQQSKNMCSSLEAEVSKVQAEFAEARKTFEREFVVAKEDKEILARELESVNIFFNQANEKVRVMSEELCAAEQKYHNLKIELADANRAAEATANDLAEERKRVSSLSEELKVLETQISRKIEAQKNLETDLEAAIKSLDDMNHAELTLLREFEEANSRICSLEDEKIALYKSLDEKSQDTLDARKNLEDTRSLMTELGNEMSRLEKRGKMLEEEVACAKSEILRLRDQINDSKLVNDQNNQNVKTGGKSAASSSKNIYRRKDTTQQDC